MQDPEVATTRRTRRLTRAQSKYGCLTCKTRKVRCDETYPICRRCTNSGFICEGYTNTRPTSPVRDTADSLQLDPGSSFTPNLELSVTPDGNIQQRLLHILQSRDIAYIGQHALDHIIATTSQLAPSSHTAISALEVLVRRDSSRTLNESESRLQVDTAYGQAIRLFVEEIQADSGSAGAVFITGIILVTIELLQRRRQDAWKHLLGSRQWLRTTTLTGPDSHDTDFLYRIYDLHSLLYSHNVRIPMIAPHDDRTLESTNAESLSFGNFEKAIVNILHPAHVLLSRLHHSDFHGTMSSSKLDEEYAYQARLRLAVSCIDRRLQLNSDPSKESAYRILRNLCVACDLEIEQLRSLNETSWDKHEEEFQSIIEASERVQLRGQETSKSLAASRQLHLTLQLGIISPLILTAFKYRHPLWRRRAIACLRNAGIEGPFIGKQLAAIADRYVQIEESGNRQSSVSGVHEASSSTSQTRLNVRMPPEDKRLAHCRTEEDNGNTEQTSTSWPQTAKGSTSVLFLARRIPATIPAAKVLTSTYFRTDDQYTSVQDQALDTTVWRTWTETIPFNGETG